MTKKRGKFKYEPPCVVNLSASSADGDNDPLGRCVDGHSPISYTCADGASPVQEDTCSPVGSLPTLGRCTNGGDAVEGCVAGSAVDDCVSGSAF